MAGIVIVVKSEVKLYSGLLQNFSVSKNINIDLGESSNEFISMYLQRSERSNMLQVRGLNGEPIPHAPTALSVKYHGIHRMATFNLTTD